jgi:hypothetical protein
LILGLQPIRSLSKKSGQIQPSGPPHGLSLCRRKKAFGPEQSRQKTAIEFLSEYIILILKFLVKVPIAFISIFMVLSVCDSLKIMSWQLLGGGFVFGSLEADAKFCMTVQERAGLVVVDVNYRHCPGKLMTGDFFEVNQ